MLKLLNNKNQDKFSVKGFTIIEATLAVVILMVGFMSVIEFFPFALKIIGDSQNLAIASNLTLSKIEEINSLPYSEIGIGTIEQKQRISGDLESYLYDFSRQTDVSYLDSNLSPSIIDSGLKKITVTTYWKSPVISGEKSTQISTIIANY